MSRTLLGLMLLTACSGVEYAEITERPSEFAVPAAEWLDEADSEMAICQPMGGGIAFEVVPANVMMLVDISGSMEGERWASLERAVGSIGVLQERADIGMSVFPADGYCGVTEPVVELGAADAESAIADALTHFGPSGATPMGAALDRLVGRPELQDPMRDNVVVMLTDGIDSCDGDPAAAVRRLVDQPVPVRLQVVGVGTYDHIDAELQDLAAVAGPMASVWEADDADALAMAMAQGAASCRFVADAAVTEVELDGVPLQPCHDTRCEDGFTTDAQGAIELHGEACQRYLASECGDVALY